MGLLSWTSLTYFVLSRNITSQLLMILLVSTHIKRYVLFLSQYPKNTRGMDLDFNLLLFSIGMCANVLQPKNSQMRYIRLCIGTCFLWGLWIKSFNWASIFDVNRCIHRLGPKLQVKSLCTNHIYNAFHDGFIGSFYNSILLWCVRCICLSLDSTFTQKNIKLNGQKFSSVVKS
jgi:hypothetical protein